MPALRTPADLIRRIEELVRRNKELVRRNRELEIEVLSWGMKMASKPRGRPIKTETQYRRDAIYEAITSIISQAKRGRRKLSVRAACNILQKQHRYRRYTPEFIRNEYKRYVQTLKKSGA